MLVCAMQVEPQPRLARPAAQAVAAAAAPADARAQALESAFAIASSVPAQFHAREKAKLQEQVGAAFVELGMLEEARGLVRRIDGWRSAALLGRVGLEDAKAGRREEALACAEKVVVASRHPSVTDWQREALSVWAARIHAAVGDDAKASELEKGVGENEMGKVAATRARRSPEESFGAQMELVEGWIKTLNFDLVRNGVDIAVEYYPTCYADAARRARVEAAIEAAAKHLPHDLRVVSWLRLADIATAKADRESAAALIGRADAALLATSWAPEDETAMRARIAASKGRLGESDAARAEIAKALAAYDAGRDRIIDIYRAKALRAVAESQASFGDADAARATYMRALDEGAVNPNARPRAADLVGTIVSMASSGLLPDAAATARIAAIRDGLKDPW